MITDFLLILLKSSIPIGLTSFGLVWWAQRQDYLGGTASMKEYEQWRSAENKSRKAEKKLLKAEKKQLKQDKRAGLSEQSTASPSPELQQQPQQKFDPLHSKWMTFGGGFYGVVALFTYMVIELVDVRDFLVKLPNLFEHGLIGLVVSFFIESMKNFITAISWPAYWLSEIRSEQWLWVIGAYAGYWLGSNAAFRFGSQRTDDK